MSEKPDWDDRPDLGEDPLAYLVRGLRAFWKLMEIEHTRIIQAVALLIAGALLSLTLPLMFKELVDYLPVVAKEGITPWAIVLVTVMVGTRTIMLLLQRFVQEPIFSRAIIHLENYWPCIAQEKLLALSIAYHERENMGSKIAKVNKGVEKLVGMLGDIFWTLLPALAYLALNAVIILAMDWRLGAIFVLPLIPAIWLHTQSFRHFEKEWAAWECMQEQSVGLFCQSVINIRTVQSLVAEKYERAEHNTIRRKMEEVDVDIALGLQRYFFAVEMIISLSFTVTIIAGLYFVYRGWSSLGTVAYITITGNATLGFLWSIVQVYSRMMRDLVAAERLYELLNEPIDVANTHRGITTNRKGGIITLEEAELRYAQKEVPTLKGLYLTIAPGEMLALIGKSGSGKSSLVNLLVRAYDPTAGRVSIDGTDIRTVDRDWYRKRFAYVPQDVEIFDGTIRENIMYGNPGATEEMLDRVVDAACLHEVVSDTTRFPNGLNTEVGERGVMLSGGERQRIGIARAYMCILLGAWVLVLDEATSSLDSESERVVQKLVAELRGKRRIAIVAIAHRLSTVRSADRICVLEDGQITETGTHEQLLRENGLYQRLVALQQLGEIRE